MAAEGARKREPAAPTESAPAPRECALGVAASFAGRAWHFREYDEAVATGLERGGLSAPLARLLAARGVSANVVSDFLTPRLRTALPDPSGLAHMDQAAARFADAVIAGETVGVLGDYDVDGACASALLLRALRAYGVPAKLYIPDRLTEGYGPSKAAVRHLHAAGTRMVVTVDTGAAATDALAFGRELGLDVIVLDHHAVDANPPAFAHVNPNGPDDKSDCGHLCATGVTFLFLTAVQRTLRARGWFAALGRAELDLIELVDLAALATVADVMPLTGVNRAFVRQGLRQLDALTRPGLAALAAVATAAPPFGVYHLGFVFGPRINAGGRVGRCDLGARLLATDSREEADALARELDRHNRERQILEAAILEQAHAMAAVQSEQPFLFVSAEGWHPGVVGLVAARLTERYGKPAFVAGYEGEGPARGSVRSVRGVDVGAIVRAAHAQGLLASGGGHAMAAGFILARAQRDAFAAYLAGSLSGAWPALGAARDLFADALIAPSAATSGLLAELERAGPFGVGYPEPVFLLPDVQLAYADTVGTHHIRLRLMGRDRAALSGIAFRAAGGALGTALLRHRGRRLHVAGRLKRDTYNGADRVQIHVEDAASAGA